MHGGTRPDNCELFDIWSGQILSDPNSGQSKRREAYEGLWQVVQDAHLRMRKSLTKGFSAGISAFLTDVNSFGWQNGIYIDEADRKLALEYLFMIYEFLRIVVQHEVAKEWVAATANIPSEVPHSLKHMYVAQDRAERLHFKLENRVRAVLGGLPNQQAAKSPTQGDILSEHFAALLRNYKDDNNSV